MFRYFLLAISLLSISILAERCPNDPFCLQCEEDRCTVCVFSVNIDGECTTVDPIIENCLEYRQITNQDGENQIICDDCILGYVLQGEKCVQTEFENCIAGDSIYTCDICDKGLKLKEEDGEDKCTGECELENCDYCGINGENLKELCFECGKGYSVDRDTLRCVKEPTENCHLNQREECKLCKRGYYSAENNTCLESDETGKSSLILRSLSLSIMLFFFYL